MKLKKSRNATVFVPLDDILNGHFEKTLVINLGELQHWRVSQPKTSEGTKSCPHGDFQKCRAFQTGAGAIIGPQSACMEKGEKKWEEQGGCGDVRKERKSQRETRWGCGRFLGGGITLWAVGCHHSPVPPETGQPHPSAHASVAHGNYRVV